MWSPAEVMAKTAAARREEVREDQVLRPVDERVRHDVERHLELGLRDRGLALSAKNGFSVPKASEWSSTETRDSGGSAAAGLRDRRDDLARACSSSAALTLKNSALRPIAAISATIRSDVRLRGLAVEVDAEDVPAGARERERAGLAEARKKLPAPRAQRVRFSADKTARMLARGTRAPAAGAGAVDCPPEDSDAAPIASLPGLLAAVIAVRKRRRPDGRRGPPGPPRSRPEKPRGRRSSSPTRISPSSTRRDASICRPARSSSTGPAWRRRRARRRGA